DGTRIRRWLLPGAPPWRHGGPVSAAGTRKAAGQRGGNPAGGRAAAVAVETGKRLAQAAPLNATLHWSQELLDAEAARVERMSTPGPLAAMPLALKDNIVTVEQPTTCGSRILEGYLSPYNATVVERLRGAGAMIAAKANLDEFAMGSS